MKIWTKVKHPKKSGKIIHHLCKFDRDSQNAWIPYTLPYTIIKLNVVIVFLCFLLLLLLSNFSSLFFDTIYIHEHDIYIPRLSLSLNPFCSILSAHSLLPGFALYTYTYITLFLCQIRCHFSTILFLFFAFAFAFAFKFELQQFFFRSLI